MLSVSNVFAISGTTLEMSLVNEKHLRVVVSQVIFMTLVYSASSRISVSGKVAGRERLGKSCQLRVQAPERLPHWPQNLRRSEAEFRPVIDIDDCQELITAYRVRDSRHLQR